MNKEKNIFKSLKNNIMLNCDSPTLLITKHEFVKLNCSEKIRLNMHLATCKFCRRFQEQSELISNNIQNISNPENNQFAHTLSEDQKQNLTKIIKENSIRN